MTAVVADTGPLYAAVDPDDAHYQRSQRESKRLIRERRDVVVPYPVLLEAYMLVLYRLGIGIASNWLEDLLSGASLINPTAEDYRVAADVVFKYTDQPITLVDATIAVLASRLGVEVWTYDHHFDVLRSSVWR
jgi:predicted nucleic acid-binding protein